MELKSSMTIWDKQKGVGSILGPVKVKHDDLGRLLFGNTELKTTIGYFDRVRSYFYTTFWPGVVTLVYYRRLSCKILQESCKNLVRLRTILQDLARFLQDLAR